jgi:hypothetical protein
VSYNLETTETSSTFSRAPSFPQISLNTIPFDFCCWNNSLICSSFPLLLFPYWYGCPPRLLTRKIGLLALAYTSFSTFYVCSREWFFKSWIRATHQCITFMTFPVWAQIYYSNSHSIFLPKKRKTCIIS